MTNTLAVHLTELRRLLDRRAPGVIVHLSQVKGTQPTVIVHLIQVPPTQRGYGMGQRVLELICQTADARGWTLGLSPVSDLGSSLPRLVRWYMDAGFVVSTAVPKQTMVRRAMEYASVA
jgi:GNAT superfamily N-acetyltransferase